MKKLLMVLLLVAAMVFVSACNRDNNGEETNGGNGGTTPPAGENGATDPVPPPVTGNDDDPVQDEVTISGIHQPRDLGGATITAAMWWEGGMAYAMPTAYYNEPDPATASNYHVYRLIWDNARRVEREFNVQFDDFVFGGAGYVIEQLTTSVLAGDPLADVIFMESWMMLSAITGDLILPIDEINLPGSDLLGDQVYLLPRAEGFGHLWAFWSSGLHNRATGIGFNLDIINAVGAPNPIELYESGQWTWDAMLEIMRMATRDTTGDGVTDQWGIAGQPGEILRHLIAANDGMLATDDFMYALDHPNTMEAMEFLERILQEELWLTDHPADVYDWGRNFWSFNQGTAALFPLISWAIDPNFPFEYRLVPFPTGPSNTSGSTWMGGWVQGYTIARGTSNAPEDILMIVEEVFSWSGDEPQLMTEGALRDAETNFRTAACANRLLQMTHTMRTDIGYIVPDFAGQLNMFADAFLTGEMSVAQAVEMHRPQLQEMLDAFR